MFWVYQIIVHNSIFLRNFGSLQKKEERKHVPKKRGVYWVGQKNQPFCCSSLVDEVVVFQWEVGTKNIFFSYLLRLFKKQQYFDLHLNVSLLFILLLFLIFLMIFSLNSYFWRTKKTFFVSLKKLKLVHFDSSSFIFFFCRHQLFHFMLRIVVCNNIVVVVCDEAQLFLVMYHFLDQITTNNWAIEIG